MRTLRATVLRWAGEKTYTDEEWVIIQRVRSYVIERIVMLEYKHL